MEALIPGAALLVSLVLFPRLYRFMVDKVTALMSPLTARVAGVPTEALNEPDYMMRAHAELMCGAVARVWDSMSAGDGGQSAITALGSLHEVAQKAVTYRDPPFPGDGQQRWDRYRSLVFHTENFIREWILALERDDAEASRVAFEKVKQSVAMLEKMARAGGIQRVSSDPTARPG